MHLTRGEKAFNVINTLILIFISIITLYPCLHVVFASFSDAGELAKHGGFLIAPLGFTFTAYEEVFKNQLIMSGYFNTFINLGIALVLNLSLTTLGAYVLSRREFMLRRQIMLLITFTMFFSGGLIPDYMLVRSLGLINTRWALIVPSAISAYNLIILRTAFEGIPDSLIESAKLDGAKERQILMHIVLPISKAALAVMFLFYAVYHWNSWFPSYIYLKDRSLWPLQLVLREIVIANNIDSMLTSIDTADKVSIGETIKYATIIVSLIPILLIYPFLQKYFVKGVMIGSVKG